MQASPTRTHMKDFDEQTVQLAGKGGLSRPRRSRAFITLAEDIGKLGPSGTARNVR